MPIYEYRCANGHHFEVFQKIADDPVASCQTCEASVERVFHPVAVHFKGSGFYNTDYGKKKGRGGGGDSGEESSSRSSSGESSSKDSSKSDSAAKKASTGSSSSKSD